MILQDRCYLVTGGAGAIGAGIGQALVDVGANVVLLDLDGGSAEKNAALIGADGGQCIGLSCDVTDTDSIRSAIATSLDRYQRVDGAVNNAGVIKMNTAWDATSDEWRQHFEVNVTGVFNVSQIVGDHLKQAGGGAIVNVASNCGKVGYANMAAYNASKAAVINMTRSLATEWAEAHINVNAVCPGGVDTAMLGEVAQWLAPRLEISAEDLLADMGPAQLGRRIDPIEVGRVVRFLLSDDAIIIRGQAINVDGGDTPY